MNSLIPPLDIIPVFGFSSLDKMEIPSMNKIIVFEDKNDRRNDLVRRLKRLLKDEVEISSIDGRGEQEKKKTYEAQLEEILREQAPDGALIVCDKDLSDLGERFIGLSGTMVAAVADTLGFPLCLYARGEGEPAGEELLKSLAPWEKKRILLEFSSEEGLANECACIFRAFAKIEEIYPKIPKESRATPAAALASILGHPGIEDRVALYGSGEQGFLEEIMPFRRDKAEETTKELTKRMPRILGNWLYTSLLRFPGILVSEIPAASFLNIDPSDFSNPEIQGIFKEARYDGPFSDLHKWWWRHKLEELFNENGCKDGLALANAKGFPVQKCDDPQSGERAGYYCMVTRQPVSDSNSKGEISWFPAGADLSRIRLDVFNELAPWVGLY